MIKTIPIRYALYLLFLMVPINNSNRAYGQESSGGKCYWIMSMMGTPYTFEFDSWSTGTTDKRTCESFDQCDGDGIHNLSGCFKWAKCMDCAREQTEEEICFNNHQKQMQDGQCITNDEICSRQSKVYFDGKCVSEMEKCLSSNSENVWQYSRCITKEQACLLDPLKKWNRDLSVCYDSNLDSCSAD